MRHRAFTDYRGYTAAAVLCGATLLAASPAAAQRVSENAVTSAEDAFGVSVGNDRIGIYNPTEIRGFNPATAGNVRIEGMYVDLLGILHARIAQSSTVRVGISTQGYPFPAPTGILDYALRTPRDELALSTAIQFGPFGTKMLEMDASVPLVDDRLSLAAGFGARVEELDPGDVGHYLHFALAPKWTPSAGVEIRPFWMKGMFLWDRVAPQISVAGGKLPTEIDREYFGQPWGRNEGGVENFGVLAKAEIGEGLVVRSGVFRSLAKTDRGFADLFLNAGPDGMADHTIIASRRQNRASTSGELRVSKWVIEGDRRHGFHLMVRGRDADNRYGGSSVVQLGRAMIGSYEPVPEPTFTFGERDHDQVRQYTAGIGYEGKWLNVGELSLGIQKIDYKKSVDTAAGSQSEIANSPFVYNAAAAAYITSRLAVYGSYSRGLEENGTAPDLAVNRFEPLPAILTSQKDAGLRYAITPDLKLVAGVFDIRKPYFNLDAGNVFTQLGAVRHRGIELSLAGKLTDDLTIVTGAVLMDPKVEGEAVRLGRVGALPIGQTDTIVRLNADYRLPFFAGASIDGGFVYNGERTATARVVPATGEQLMIPARTTFDLGARYRFKAAGVPTLLRIAATNVSDVKGWRVSPSGAFQLSEPRRVSLSVAADF